MVTKVYSFNYGTHDTPFSRKTKNASIMGCVILQISGPLMGWNTFVLFDQHEKQQSDLTLRLHAFLHAGLCRNNVVADCNLRSF
jgi:hypothetical protein